MSRHTISKLLLLIVFTTSISVTSVSCASKQLDRKTAAGIIRRSSPFTQPYKMIVKHGTDRRYLDPVSPDETRQQGEARAVESWRTSFPYRAVLVHLGLVTVRARYQSTTMYGEREGRSTYDLDIDLTDAGRKLWQDLGMQVDPASIPLGRRRLVAITGIRGGGAAKGSRATVEFTWEWELTTAGTTMSAGTPEFARLPDEVKTLFDSSQQVIPTFKPKTPLNLIGAHQGVANFLLYDDGWRLDSIEPMGTAPFNPLD
ncbi:MAG TPA: hypothetical protein VF297_18345 [Pyrinomonadaceae bacterium]